MPEHQDKIPETETTEALNKARALQIAKIMGRDEAEVLQYLSEINSSLQDQSKNYFVKGCLNDMFAFELAPRDNETKYTTEYKKLPKSTAEIYDWPIEETIGNLRAVCLLVNKYRGINPVNIVKWRLLLDLLETCGNNNKTLPVNILKSINIDDLKDLENTGMMNAPYNVFKELIGHYIERFKERSKKHQFYGDLYKNVIPQLEELSRAQISGDIEKAKKILEVIQNEVEVIDKKTDDYLDKDDEQKMIQKFGSTIGAEMTFMMSLGDRKKIEEIMASTGHEDTKQKTLPVHQPSGGADFLDWLTQKYEQPMDFLNDVLNLKNGNLPIKPATLN